MVRSAWAFFRDASASGRTDDQHDLITPVQAAVIFHRKPLTMSNRYFKVRDVEGELSTFPKELIAYQGHGISQQHWP